MTSEDQSKRLLSFLVAHLPNVIAKDPRTFLSYKDVHEELGLPQVRNTFGESLKAQGLSELAEWTFAAQLPAITGIIVDRETMMPGKGYFSLFGKKDEDFSWWIGEIERAKRFNWSAYIDGPETSPTPSASDIETPPERISLIVYRILRDSLLARRVKHLNNYECQICGHTIFLPNGTRYAEAHHIRPLGAPHNGPDTMANILCLCPNHHAELDYGIRQLALNQLRLVSDHVVGDDFVAYHNAIIHQSA